jgi:hypothetical protein
VSSKVSLAGRELSREGMGSVTKFYTYPQATPESSVVVSVMTGAASAPGV